jgi:hypothetical protein
MGQLEFFPACPVKPPAIQIFDPANPNHVREI